MITLYLHHYFVTTRVLLILHSIHLILSHNTHWNWSILYQTKDWKKMKLNHLPNVIPIKLPICLPRASHIIMFLIAMQTQPVPWGSCNRPMLRSLCSTVTHCNFFVFLMCFSYCRVKLISPNIKVCLGHGTINFLSPL